MSTILNALKKIEQDRHPGHVDDAAKLVSTTPRRSFRWPSGRGLIRRRWVWMIVPLVGLFIGGVFSGVLVPRSTPVKSIGSSQFEPEPQPTVEPDPIQKRPPSRDIAEAPHNRATPSLQPMRSVVEVQGTAMEPTEMASSTSDAVKQSFKTGSISVPATPSNNLPKTAKRTAVTPQKAKPPAIAKNAQKPDPVLAAGGSLPFQAPRMTDNRLTVQAIVWSPAVEDRMAVINNNIMRQGGKVDGFTVEAIGEDQILVREGQQHYVVPFGSR